MVKIRNLASIRVQLSERQADLSGDMALRIEKAFGVKMDTLMRDAIRLRYRADPEAREGNFAFADSTALRIFTRKAARMRTR
jgi:hypothetical protein